MWTKSHWNPTGISLKSQCDFTEKFGRNPNGISVKSQWDFTEIPVRFHWNPSEISLKSGGISTKFFSGISLKSQWDFIEIPLGSQWNLTGISVQSHWKFGWNPTRFFKISLGSSQISMRSHGLINPISPHDHLSVLVPIENLPIKVPSCEVSIELDNWLQRSRLLKVFT